MTPARRPFLVRAYGALKRRTSRAAFNVIERPTVALFHKLFYHHRGPQTWEATSFLGTRILKCPLDMWIYQEILFETRPDLVIETGTFNGGSALYMASLLDLMGHGEIVSIDIDPQSDLPEHPRIRYVRASSVDEAVVGEMLGEAKRRQRTMVVLDSDHSRDHVLAEMRAYHRAVTPGCYMIVEDGNVNGHPVFGAHGPGPTEAIRTFLGENGDFEVDRSRERFLLTFNPGGYLRRR